MITGAQGGHPDTAAGAKCTIVIAPLFAGENPGYLYQRNHRNDSGRDRGCCHYRLRYRD